MGIIAKNKEKATKTVQKQEAIIMSDSIKIPRILMTTAPASTVLIKPKFLIFFSELVGLPTHYWSEIHFYTIYAFDGNLLLYHSDHCLYLHAPVSINHRLKG